MEVIFWFMKYRSVLLNLLFVCYIAFLQPSLLERLQATRGYSIPDPLIGSVLLILPLVEFAAIRLKLPVFACGFKSRFPSFKHLFQNSRLHLFAGVGGTLSLAFGMSVAVVFAVAAIKVLDILNLATFLVAGFGAAAFKAWTVMLLWYGASFGELGLRAPKQVSLELMLRDLLGDALLLVYSAVGYTVLWEAGPFFSGASWGHSFYVSFFPGTTWGDDLFALLYFLSIYIVLRSIYLLQDVFLETSRTVKLGSFLSFALVLVMAMLSVPQR